MMQSATLLIVALPVVSALLTLALGKGRPARIARISAAALTLTFLLTTGQLVQSLRGDGADGILALFGWKALLLDPLGCLMSWVIAGIALIVHLYSRRYMIEEAGYTRFFVLLNLMTAALLGLVVANDLIVLVALWHLVGVLLYLLLAFDLSSRPAQAYATWTLVTFRLGDVPLVLAAVLAAQAYETWSLSDILAAMAADPQGMQVLGLPLPEVVATLVALSAFARSAQIITHLWLPYTMEGPTPVSALMHAGIVNAGGFLINRFAPMFPFAGDALHLMVLVGLATAIIGSMLMLTQNDIKKSLGYSTMGQMGFMIMECGVGAFSLAIYHLIAHGVFKGTLFLGAGGVIGAARRDDGVPAEDLYTFVVERRMVRRRRPWLLMAALTVIVPAIILFLAHYGVDQAYFEKQGAIILLFFGWMTGAQLVFATHHMRTDRPIRLFLLILTSFIVVIVGYVVISHALDVFLYPDPALRANLYSAAGIDGVQFDIIVALMTVLFVLGWLFTAYNERRRLLDRDRIALLRRWFWRVCAREFHFPALLSAITRAVVTGAQRTNQLLGGR